MFMKHPRIYVYEAPSYVCLWSTLVCITEATAERNDSRLTSPDGYVSSLVSELEPFLLSTDGQAEVIEHRGFNLISDLPLAHSLGSGVLVLSLLWWVKVAKHILNINIEYIFVF